MVRTSPGNLQGNCHETISYIMLLVRVTCKGWVLGFLHWFTPADMFQLPSTYIHAPLCTSDRFWLDDSFPVDWLNALCCGIVRQTNHVFGWLEHVKPIFLLFIPVNVEHHVLIFLIRRMTGLFWAHWYLSFELYSCVLVDVSGASIPFLLPLKSHWVLPSGELT